jgi:hypothetical protein
VRAGWGRGQAVSESEATREWRGEVAVVDVAS